MLHALAALVGVHAFWEMGYGALCSKQIRSSFLHHWWTDHWRFCAVPGTSCLRWCKCWRHRCTYAAWWNILYSSASVQVKRKAGCTLANNGRHLATMLSFQKAEWRELQKKRNENIPRFMCVLKCLSIYAQWPSFMWVGTVRSHVHFLLRPSEHFSSMITLALQIAW